ncbi:MAG: DUF4837 family protein [Cyclobacteriaceae bacterium]
MNRILNYSIVPLLFLLILTGCNKNGKTSKSMLPPASGKPGEMIVVIDSLQWSGELGETIRETFGADVPNLPREEKMFKMNRVEPSKMTRILRTVKNLVFVVTLDRNSPAARRIRSYFTDESLERIKNEPDLYVFTAEDEFARGQQVMYLFGQTEEQLISAIEENAANLQQFFNQTEQERLYERLYSEKASEGLTKSLRDQFGCYMNFPFGYRVEHIYQSENGQKGFMWFRQMNPKNDKNIFVSYIPYRSENIFQPMNLVDYRDSVARKQLFADPAKPETYIKTETNAPVMPVSVQETTFKGEYAVKMQGLWKTNSAFMGGPFVSYSMVDQATNRFYYIEGFVYSPGESQREHMREMKVILSTFRTEEMMSGENSPAAE